MILADDKLSDAKEMLSQFFESIFLIRDNENFIFAGLAQSIMTSLTKTVY